MRKSHVPPVKFFRFIIVLFLFLHHYLLIYTGIVFPNDFTALENTLLWNIMPQFNVFAFRFKSRKNYLIIRSIIFHTHVLQTVILPMRPHCVADNYRLFLHWHFAASLNVSNMHPVESTRTASLDTLLVSS